MSEDKILSVINILGNNVYFEMRNFEKRKEMNCYVICSFLKFKFRVIRNS